jgi:hypothetical protein
MEGLAWDVQKREVSRAATGAFCAGVGSRPRGRYARLAERCMHQRSRKTAHALFIVARGVRFGKTIRNGRFAATSQPTVT